MGKTINEVNPNTEFSVYKQKILNKLTDMQRPYIDNGDQSARSILDAVQTGRYDEMILRNIKNSIEAEKTAEYIRDHWYGV